MCICMSPSVISASFGDSVSIFCDRAKFFDNRICWQVNGSPRRFRGIKKSDEISIDAKTVKILIRQNVFERQPTTAAMDKVCRVKWRLSRWNRVELISTMLYYFEHAELTVGNNTQAFCSTSSIEEHWRCTLCCLHNCKILCQCCLDCWYGFASYGDNLPVFKRS